MKKSISNQNHVEHFISLRGTVLLLGQGWAVAAAELAASWHLLVLTSATSAGLAGTAPCLLRGVSDRSERLFTRAFVPICGAATPLCPSSHFLKPQQGSVWGRAHSGSSRGRSPGARGSSASVPPRRGWQGLRRARRKRRPWFSTITTSPGPLLAPVPCGSCAPHPGTRGECRGRARCHRGVTASPAAAGTRGIPSIHH